MNFEGIVPAHLPPDTARKYLKTGSTGHFWKAALLHELLSGLKLVTKLTNPVWHVLLGIRKRFDSLLVKKSILAPLVKIKIFLHSHHMRRYWFYVKNHFWNFYQNFTFWDPLNQKNQFLRKYIHFPVKFNEMRKKSFNKKFFTTWISTSLNRNIFS